MRLKSKNLLPGKLVVFILILCFGLTSCKSGSKIQGLKQVDLDGVTIKYQSTGRGYPLIMVHGSLTDLLYWRNQDSVLSKSFRIITYSRRYNYPNNNIPQPEHSALVEAKDLLAIMDKLKIPAAYILGHSYGAYTALLFALDHPKRVNKLILAEPPLVRWLPQIPNGQGKMENFLQHGWGPIGKAFLEFGDRAGLDATTRWFYQTPLDSIPKELRKEMLRNVKEWRALATASDAYPLVDTARVKNLKIPTLLLSGSRNAGKINGLIDGELSILLPDNRQAIIPNAGHEMFQDNPGATNQAIVDFLKKP